MNGPEKKILYLAFSLWVLGVVVRVIPWGLPTIDHFQVEAGLDGFLSNLEYGPVAVHPESSESFSAVPDDNVDKLIKDSVPDLSMGIVQEESQKKGKKAKKTKKVVKLPLHINTASVEDLCALSGVGPKLAEKIVAYREQKGPIKNAGDLKKVPGIGAKKLESILPGVIFD